FSLTFRIGGSNDRGMEIYKAAFVEETMDGKGQCMAHSKHGSESIGAETQVCDLAQIFQAGTVLQLYRIFFRITFAQKFDSLGFYFHFLTFTLRGYDNSFNT